MVRPVGRINLQMPVQNPYQQRFYNGNNSASAVFSLDGKYMASMDVQAALQLYDAGTGKILRQINHNTMLNCLAFSPDGKTLLGTQADNMGMGVHLFDVASGKHLRQLDEAPTRSILARWPGLPTAPSWPWPGSISSATRGPSSFFGMRPPAMRFAR